MESDDLFSHTRLGGLRPINWLGRPGISALKQQRLVRLQPHVAKRLWPVFVSHEKKTENQDVYKGVTWEPWAHYGGSKNATCRGWGVSL
jgi:hypothetical protein